MIDATTGRRAVVGTVLLVVISFVPLNLSAQGIWRAAAELPTGAALRAVDKSDDGGLVGVGENGRVVRSSDDGITWNEIESGLPAQFSSSLNAVSFGGNGIGLAVGRSATSIRTTDGGRNWTSLPIADAAYFNDVEMLDASFAAIAGGALIQSDDTGSTWKWETFQHEGNVTGLVLFDSAHWIGIGPGGVVGSGTVYVRQPDSGWNVVIGAAGHVMDYNAVAFNDVGVGVVVGSSGFVMRSTDYGVSWSVGASGVTQDLRDVAFVSLDEVVAVGDSGRIIRSPDGGATWTAEASPTTVPLRGVCAGDNGTAVAVGGEDSGVILYLDGTSSGLHALNSGGPVDWSVSPNPMHDRLVLTVGNAVEGERVISLHTVLGRVIRSERIRSGIKTTWDVSELPAGPYVLSVESGDRRECRSVVVY